MKTYIILLMLSILALTGCTNKTTDFNTHQVEKITFELKKKENLKGAKSYSFYLFNNSKFTIKQNDVFVSFPIKTSNGEQGNTFKVLAGGNKLNIKPKEKVLLHAFIPLEGINRKIVNLNSPQVEIRGYGNVMDEKHMFATAEQLN